MYRKETFTAQKRNYRKQIVDYLQSNNIRHSFVKADAKSDLDPSAASIQATSNGIQEEEKVMLEPARRTLQKGASGGRQGGFTVKVKQIQKNVKQKGFLQQIPDQVMEDDQESSGSENSDVQIAKNTLFADADQVFFSDEEDYESGLAMDFYKRAGKNTKGGRTSALGGLKSSFGSSDKLQDSPALRKSRIGRGL
jgi:hypothetical protein